MKDSLGGPWWVRPAKALRVLRARREVRRWRLVNDVIEARAEIASGQLDGAELDDVACPHCWQLVPVGECHWVGDLAFHAPHASREARDAIARGRRRSTTPR